MASIKYRDPELEGSFSFSSCYDFNSSLTVFSDNDDDASDDESYIEIAFEPTPTNDNDDYNGIGDPGEDLELRISFSSAVPLASESETVSSSSSSSTKSTLSCSSTETCWGPPVETNPSRISKTVNWREGSPAVNCMLDSGALLKTGDKDGLHNHLEFLQSRSSYRKESKATKKTNSGVMMKFLIKFRTINIRALLASFVKPPQAISTQGNNGNRKKRSEETLGTYQSLIKPFDKWLVQREHGKNLFGNGERSRVLDINLDAVRGVLESMRLVCKDKRTKSCPSSTKSSPIHQGIPSESKVYARENSIQAAIAHCKSSFGQTSDFCL